MKKEEYIRKFGEDAYERKLEDNRKYRGKGGPSYEKKLASARKGGLGYAHLLEYNGRRLRHGRNLIRQRHRGRWTKYKNIVAPRSEIHHEWIPGTVNYRGVALVEADKHHYGIIDVIQILGGEITLVSGL